jgi:multidrug efflux pump subunit AcrB
MVSHQPAPSFSLKMSICAAKPRQKRWRNSSYDYTARQMDIFAHQIVDEIPEIYRTISIVGARGGGANSGFQIIFLKDPDDRTRDQAAIFRQISGITGRFDGLRGAPSQPPTIGSRRGGSPVQFVLKAPNFDALLEQIPRFMDEVQKSPTMRFADIDLQANNPEVSVKINRARAAELDISVAYIGRTLQLAFSDSRFGYFLKDGRQYQNFRQILKSHKIRISLTGLIYL